MSTMWRNILVYLGLVEEPEEHDEYERSRRGEHRERNRRPRSRERRSAPASGDRDGARGRAPARDPDRDPARDRARGSRRERSRSGGNERSESADGSAEHAGAGAGANVRSLRSARDRPAHVRPVDAGIVRVGIVRAVDFDDAEKVGERYRTGQPVLLDLGEVDSRTGRRLLDFVSGLIYALRGRIKSAGGRAFLLLPDGVDVPLEERRRLADLGYHVQTSPSAEA